MSSEISYFPNQSIQCKSCKQEIILHQPNDVVILACPSCGKIHTFNSESVLNKYAAISNNFKTKASILPLYAEGKYQDFNFKIIGIVEKTDNKTKWYEYQLIDQFGNTHILSQWEGHFHLFQEVDEITIHAEQLHTIKKNTTELEFKGEQYRKLQKYGSLTISLIGEFPYDVINSRDLQIIDFIAPPEIISVEFNRANLAFYKGVYLSHSTIDSIFYNYQVQSPSYGTVGMAQPFFKGMNMAIVNKIITGFLILLTLIQLYSIFNLSSERTFLTSDLDTATYSKENAISRSFKLNETTGSYYIKVTGMCSLNNQWIEDVITLVNEKTGEEREFSVGMEYYSGIDNGYTWSEGSDINSIHISDVKPGKYHIKQKIYTSVVGETLPIRLSITNDSPSGWNYRVILFTTLILFSIINYRRLLFEENRTGHVYSFFKLLYQA